MFSNEEQCANIVVYMSQHCNKPLMLVMRIKQKTKIKITPNFRWKNRYHTNCECDDTKVSICVLFLFSKFNTGFEFEISNLFWIQHWSLFCDYRECCWHIIWRRKKKNNFFLRQHLVSKRCSEDFNTFSPTFFFKWFKDLVVSIGNIFWFWLRK